jgi:hypothetical protein
VMKKCLVFGCENHSNQGTFIGDLCAPCHRLITTGEVNYGHDFITTAIKERDAAHQLIGRLVCEGLR